MCFNFVTWIKMLLGHFTLTDLVKSTSLYGNRLLLLRNLAYVYRSENLKSICQFEVSICIGNHMRPSTIKD